MYKFEKHRSRGREPNWELADRNLVPNSEADLKKRVKKPAAGAVHTRINSRDMNGNKSKQVDQLLRDIRYVHPDLDAEVASIELHGLKLDGKTGKTGASKMIIIVKRMPRRASIMTPVTSPHQRNFDLRAARVDLRTPLIHQDATAYQLPGAQHQWQPGEQGRFGAFPTQQYVDPAFGHNVPRMHHPHQPHAHNNYQTHDHHDVHDHQNLHDHRDVHDHHDLHDHHQAEKEGSPPNHSDKAKKSKDKQGGSSPKIIPVKPSKQPKYHFESDSTIDSESYSEADTDDTPNTLFSTSTGSPRSDKRFSFGEKDKDKQQGKARLEPSREHRREDKIECMNDRRGPNYRKEHVTVMPASSHDHRRRDASYHRDRPLHSRSGTYEDGHPRYDYPPSDRRGSVYERPRITRGRDLQDELDLEREERHKIEAENARLKREVREKSRERHERRPRRGYSDDDYVRVERH